MIPFVDWTTFVLGETTYPTKEVLDFGHIWCFRSLYVDGSYNGIST